ncbi:MAG: hypothetical protein HY664_06655 [Chloroflexi bacterium]|nr:hypothetical protein [Chloroflexota bacterium]
MSYQELLLNAEWFCGQAEAATHGVRAQTRFSTASILFSFIAIESFINNMMSDFASLPHETFTVYEQGFLAEKAVEFAESGADAGKFRVSNRERYWGLDSKIMFLIARFSRDTVDKGSTLWQRFENAKEVRDLLTHPRKDTAGEPSPSDAHDTLIMAKDIIQLVSQRVWGKSVQF